MSPVLPDPFWLYRLLMRVGMVVALVSVVASIVYRARHPWHAPVPGSLRWQCHALGHALAALAAEVLSAAWWLLCTALLVHVLWSLIRLW